MVILLIAGCQDSGVARKVGSSRKMFPDQESWESTVSITREGRMVARASSRRMVQYDRQNLAHLFGDVEVDFYNSEGEHVSTMKADSADINMLTNNMNAFGNVVIHSDSGLVLHTQILNWSNEYDMVSTPESVMFATPELDTLFGIGFESDVDLTHWKIFKPSGVTNRGLADDR